MQADPDMKPQEANLGARRACRSTDRPDEFPLAFSGMAHRTLSIQRSSIARRNCRVRA